MRWVMIAIGGMLVPGLAPAARPNVVVVITDDQGFGDLGCHGNPVLKTPVLDQLSKQSVRLTQFQVSPVCAPTRASLMTGRYNYRTRAVDTIIGRAMMDPDEKTIAECLREAGYRTGLFGKWHLGDNYPLRPMEQGFEEALYHQGGGLAQVSDHPDNRNSYFDPWLRHNGKWVKSTGYCSDVFTKAAIRFIEQESTQPFFVYLAYNAPHGPFQVPDADRKPYLGIDLSPAVFPKVGQPLTGKTPVDDISRAYGMIANIDRNLGTLFDCLTERKLAENTIVVFLTDNGPPNVRYNAGMRGRKGTVYQGGIRVPCFIRWPGQLPANEERAVPAAHIDLMPTLLDACQVPLPKDRVIDGQSLLPLLKDAKATLPPRTLFTQWHRGDVPQPHRAFAAREGKYKLVQAAGAGVQDAPKVYELFDLDADPYEQTNLAAKHPEIVERLKKAYDAWFADVSATRGYDPPKIVLGSDRENPALLTRQDWRGDRAGWGPQNIGHWEVKVEQAGTYRAKVRFPARKADMQLRLLLGEASWTATVPTGQTEVELTDLKWPAGPARLKVELGEGLPFGPHYVEIERRPEPKP